MIITEQYLLEKGYVKHKNCYASDKLILTYKDDGYYLRFVQNIDDVYRVVNRYVSAVEELENLEKAFDLFVRTT